LAPVVFRRGSGSLERVSACFSMILRSHFRKAYIFGAVGVESVPGCRQAGRECVLSGMALSIVIVPWAHQTILGFVFASG